MTDLIEAMEIIDLVASATAPANVFGSRMFPRSYPLEQFCAYMKNRLIRLLFALSALSASFAHADENFFTPVNSRACTDRSRPEFGLWRCPGPAGYVAEYFDEGNLAAISILDAQPHTKSKNVHRLARRPVACSVKSFNGKSALAGPLRAILRIWRTDTKSDGQEREVEELMILRVWSDGAVGFGSIEARQLRANEIAERQSEGASALPCLDDW